MCCVSVNQKSINDGFFLNTRAFISAVCRVSCPQLPGGEGWPGGCVEPSSPVLPPPALSVSWEMKGLDLKIGLSRNYSRLTWGLLFLIKPLSSSPSSLLASGHSGEKMHLHISAQLCCLSCKSRENAWVWIAGYHTALNLSSRILLLKILQPRGSGPADPLSPGSRGEW